MLTYKAATVSLVTRYNAGERLPEVEPADGLQVDDLPVQGLVKVDADVGVVPEVGKLLGVLDQLPPDPAGLAVELDGLKQDQVVVSAGGELGQLVFDLKFLSTGERRKKKH